MPSAASTAPAASVDRSSDLPVVPALAALSEVLGVPDLDPELLTHALTHRSYSYENGQIPNNERLEFLGDSVLRLVVTETLFTKHPDLPEGQLAKLRAAVVSAKALAVVARIHWQAAKLWAKRVPFFTKPLPPAETTTR